MRRKLAAALAIAVTSIGLTTLAAAPASAAPAIGCNTADYSVPDIYAEAGGQIKILGWHNASYVGQYGGIGSVYRIWHYTYTSNNGGGTHYTGGAAVRCNSANEQLGFTDLTKETLTASDHPKCGVISYTVGSNSYTYIGSRYNDGDKFRYWGQFIDGGTFFFKGTSSVRCD
ncbi:hypothetical protein Rhe02_64670 [Rhizocola hellebori]|uniref:Secreted protein n=1 Tax=Rhizocola hellebori TaxID=1392758 RepID=A0A8J3QD10_9ACTN|nr:hypothetical protein [Rhizocola hellebori]GIH08400.1 hypothetical protein Rhe02_64670 [Rhizocola hellebori]